MTAYPEEPTPVILARLEEAETVAVDQRKRVKSHRRVVRRRTIDLVIGVVVIAAVGLNIVAGFIGFMYLDSGRDGLELLLTGLTSAVLLHILDFSWKKMRARRAFAQAQLAGSQAFLSMAEGMAEGARERLASRVVADVD